MLTTDQEKWIDHLSDQDRVSIFPYDPTATQKFEAVRRKIQAVLGSRTQVLHRGATGLGISGQDEIDVYIPVPEALFEDLLAPLTAEFGEPGSHYPGERARFVTVEEGKHVGIFLVNENTRSWSDSLRFEQYLKIQPSALEAYRLLKEAGDGLTTREYYRRKIEFINDILARVERLRSI